VQDPERSWSNGLGVDDQALQDGPLLAGPLPAGDGVLPGVVVTWLVARGWRGWRAGGAMGCICGGSRCRGTLAGKVITRSAGAGDPAAGGCGRVNRG
jgi:hypothetical protein